MRDESNQCRQDGLSEIVEQQIDSYLAAHQPPPVEACKVVEDELLLMRTTRAIRDEIKLIVDDIEPSGDDSFRLSEEEFTIVVQGATELPHLLEVSILLTINPPHEPPVYVESPQEELDTRSLRKHVRIITHEIFDGYHKRLINTVRRVWEAGLNRLESYLREFHEQQCNDTVTLFYKCLRDKLQENAEQVILFLADDKNGVYICDKIMFRRVYNHARERTDGSRLSSLQMASSILTTVMDLELTEANKATLEGTVKNANLNNVTYRNIGGFAGVFLRSERLLYGENNVFTHPLIREGAIHLSAGYPSHLAGAVKEALEDPALHRALQEVINTKEVLLPSSFVNSGGILIVKDSSDDRLINISDSREKAVCDSLRFQLNLQLKALLDFTRSDDRQFESNRRGFISCRNYIEKCVSEEVLRHALEFIENLAYYHSPVEQVLKKLISILKEGVRDV
jgi:hypothetical protein